MVETRTLDADRVVNEALARGVRQFVALGVGLDCRCFRLLGNQPDAIVFEIDRPAMLAERERSLSRVPALPPVRRVQIPLDLETDDVGRALRHAPDFDPAAPTACLCEGVSMYLTPSALDRMIAGLLPLLQPPASRLWIDVVHRSVVDGTSGHASVDRFVAELARLGDVFVQGLDDPAAWFAARGYHAARLVASDYGASTSDPIFGLYHFCEAAPALSQRARSDDSSSRGELVRP